MMNPKSGLFFLIPLTLCLSLHAANLKNTATGGSLIAKACGESPQRKEFCLSLLNSYPNSQDADLQGLAFIVLNATVKNATDIASQINGLLTDNVAMPALDEALTNCKTAYDGATDLIQDSVTALVSNAYGDVQIWLAAVIADIDNCQAGIKGQSDVAAELSRKSRVLRQLCNTALGMVNILARG